MDGIKRYYQLARNVSTIEELNKNTFIRTTDLCFPASHYNRQTRGRTVANGNRKKRTRALYTTARLIYVAV